MQSNVQKITCQLVFSLLCVLLVSGLTDVDQRCTKKHDKEFSNDYLVGTWYEVYRFNLFDSLVACYCCPTIEFYKPTPEVVEQYKKKYNSSNLPYSFDDNPVIRNYSKWAGIVTGRKNAKFFVLEPSNTGRYDDGYSATVYIPVKEKYLLFFECALREHAITLLSREKHPPEDEVQQIIKTEPLINRLEKQRLCLEKPEYIPPISNQTDTNGTEIHHQRYHHINPHIPREHLNSTRIKQLLDDPRVKGHINDTKIRRLLNDTTDKDHFRRPPNRYHDLSNHSVHFNGTKHKGNN